MKDLDDGGCDLGERPTIEPLEYLDQGAVALLKLPKETDQVWVIQGLEDL